MKEKSFLVLCFSFLVIGVFFLCQFRNWGSGSGGVWGFIIISLWLGARLGFRYEEFNTC